MNLIVKIVFLSLTLQPLAPRPAQAQVLFFDSFDGRADWSVPYAAGNQGCSKEAGCSNVPAGYYGYYISRSVILPTTGHGLHLNGTNRRGSAGKGLTFWDQTDGSLSWTSGMQIGLRVPDQKEIYLRYWMKMQPGYRYFKGPSGSMMRKLNHISHYVGNGRPFTFFTAGGHRPTTVNQLCFTNANRANLQLSFFIRPDPDYNGSQSHRKRTTPLGTSTRFGVYNFFDIPGDTLKRGDYQGTGTDFDAVGMLADGEWHSLEFYLKNNSAPGVADGAYRFWFDGVPQIEADDLLYRDAASTLPDAIWNFIHLGGNARNPFLGMGVKGEQWYAIDDLIVSTSYSGPPPKPDHVRAKAVSDSAIKVAWRKGSLNTEYNLAGYRVYYGTDAARLTNSVTVAPSATEAVLTGLAAGTRYYFAVTAFSKGSGDANENESLRATGRGVTTDSTSGG